MKLSKVCDCDEQKEKMMGRGRLDLMAPGRAKSTDKGGHTGLCQQWAEVPNALTPCYNSIKSIERWSPKRRAQSLVMAVGLIKGVTEVWLYLWTFLPFNDERTQQKLTSPSPWLWIFQIPELWEISCEVVVHQLPPLRYFCYSISSAFQVRPSYISSDVPPRQEVVLYLDTISPWDATLW